MRRRRLIPVALVLALIVVLTAAGGTAAANAEPTFQGTIAYEVHSNKTGWVETLDLASGRVTRLTDPVPAMAGADGPAWDLAWSPSGEKLALATAAPSYGPSVKVVDVATRQVTNIAVSLPAWGLAWSPDGTSIAFTLKSRLDSGRSGIYVAKPGTPGARRLYDVPLGPVSWSPDSARVAFIEEPGHHREGCSKNTRIVVKTLAGGGSTEIRAQPAHAKATYEVGSLSWRPSGGTLLYVANDTAPLGGRGECYPFDNTGAAAFVVDPPRTKSTRLLTTSSGWIRDATWSPAGRQIAMHYGHGHPNDRTGASTLRVMTARGQAKRTLVSGFRGQFAWTRTGGELIEAGATKILLRDVASGRARALARWRRLDESWGEIFAVGRQAVAVHAGQRVHRDGSTLERTVALALLGGGGSKTITLKPPSSAHRIGDVAVTLP